MRLGVRAALIDGNQVRGDVIVDDGLITQVGVLPAGARGLAVPGFVELQVNGFGGVDFVATDVDGYHVAGQALAATGVTAYQPTIVSSPIDITEHAVVTAGKAQHETDGPRLLGVHLEGPFLAPKFKGAHDERWLLPPDLRVAKRLCAAGPVTFMTIAPELPGGFELLAFLVERGVTVALGHTGADAATAHTAYNRGARGLTHLHNAQRRFTSRDPGVSAVALTRSDVTVGLIADFVHLAPETVLLAWLAAPGRVALVTDAIAAAEAPAGMSFTLGDRMIHISDAARLDGGTLAGSVLTMAQAIRNVVSLGVPLPDAVRGAAAVPARLVGRPELATLQPATPADIAVLDEELAVVRTVVAGREVWAAA